MGYKDHLYSGRDLRILSFHIHGKRQQGSIILTGVRRHTCPDARHICSDCNMACVFLMDAVLVLCDEITKERIGNMNILVSACLLGVACRYDGKEGKNYGWLEHYPDIHFIPVCPEQLGGLPTPRVPAERMSKTKEEKGRVVTADGRDVTKEYERGAEEALRLAKLYHCQAAILKERSPSCGNKEIYDGSFSHTKIEGEGVTAEKLRGMGIQVYGESEAEEVLQKYSRII